MNEKSWKMIIFALKLKIDSVIKAKTLNAEHFDDVNTEHFNVVKRNSTCQMQSPY